MADIKVKDLTDTTNIDLQNQIMVLTNDENNQVQNITVENLLSNVLSSDNGNVLEQGTDGKLYVETPENITGDLADLSTINKTSLVNAINEVDSDITDEATTRANADNNLQSQIDAITSASDVTDIVGTYAQLQAYDTTGLPDNSIIKVLQDESRQDETTYYRWVITGGVGAWVLIGEEGPYYTKSQADSLFATRQTTGNLASLDTSDKTSLVNAINELSSVLDPTQTADYINNSKAVESGAISSNSIILSNVIKYAHSTFDRSKFTVIGSPNITDDGIASGFSRDNYIQLNGFTIPTDKSFEIQLETIITAELIQSNTENRYLGTSGTRTLRGALYPQFGMMAAWFWIYNTSTSASEQLSVDKTGQDDIKTANLVAGDIIEIHLGRNKEQNIYYCQYRKNKTGDFNYFYKESEYDLTPTTGNLLLGTIAPASGSCWNGLYNLKQFSITVDGVPVFSGNKTGIDTIKPDNYTVVGTPTISADGIASGFSSSNYIDFTSNVTSLTSTFKVTGIFTTPASLPAANANIFSIMNTNNRNWTRLLLQTDGYLRFSINVGGTGVNDITTNALSLSTKYEYEVGQNADGTMFLKYRVFGSDTWIEKDTTNSLINLTAVTAARIGQAPHNTDEAFTGTIDLNAFKIYVDGSLVYQPCLKIPYTKGSEQYGGKYVNAQYLPRVKDAYEQGLANDYFTLDEVNGTYTLPMGNLYGMIEKLNQLAKDEIGLPKATLSNTLNDNEIWLEGAEVSKLTYSKLYAIYGDDYGTPTDSANFVLPDCRDRVMQGIGSGGSFGYVEAGLPNITGSVNLVDDRSKSPTGAFYEQSISNFNVRDEDGNGHKIFFDASRSNSIYGNSTTVQPPAIKVRFKTRFQ